MEKSNKELMVKLNELLAVFGKGLDILKEIGLLVAVKEVNNTIKETKDVKIKDKKIKEVKKGGEKNEKQASNNNEQRKSNKKG